MSVRRMVWALALTLAAQPALAEQARERDAGSSGSRSDSGGSRSDSGARDRQPSPSGSSHSYSSRDSSSSSPSSSYSDSGTLTDAQRRHPRPGMGHGQRTGVYYPYNFYGPYSRYYGFYPYDYYSFYGGYGSYYPRYPYTYGGYRYAYRETGSVRLLVDPPETRDYVDGYYAGVVDDFDGVFQRLHISPGRHEIALKLEGYRAHRVKLYVPVGHTLKIRHDMVRGSGEDAAEDLGGGPDREAYERRSESGEDRDDEDTEDVEAADAGTLRLSVRPDDASIYVDGEFRGTPRQARNIRLTPGRHRIEVVRPGFRTFEREVELRPGRTVELEVELERPY